MLYLYVIIRVGNKVKVQIITPQPPNILEIPIKVFYLSCRKATHNVNSSTWTKNLVTQLPCKTLLQRIVIWYFMDHVFSKLISKSFSILVVVCIWMHCTDVMFIDGTSLPVVATFHNKYIAVVSTRSKFLLPLCTYSTVHTIVANFKPFEFSTPLL